jgi:hypothetical protein
MPSVRRSKIEPTMTTWRAAAAALSAAVVGPGMSSARSKLRASSDWLN